MWTVQNGIFATVHDANGDRIATIAASINEHERARLIAAAPDLLAALATMLGIAELDALDDTSNVWRSAMMDARAAIAKAEGQQ